MSTCLLSCFVRRFPLQADPQDVGSFRHRTWPCRISYFVSRISLNKADKSFPSHISAFCLSGIMFILLIEVVQCRGKCTARLTEIMLLEFRHRHIDSVAQAIASQHLLDELPP